MSLVQIWVVSIPFIILISFVGSAFLVRKKIINKRDVTESVEPLVLACLVWPAVPIVVGLILIVWGISFTWNWLAGTR